MIDFDSSSALDELELGAFAAPTGFTRPAKQSTSASNDHQKNTRELSLKGTSPLVCCARLYLRLNSNLTETRLRLSCV